MVRKLTNLSDEERLTLIFHGADYKVSGTIYGIIEDIKDYKMYKSGKIFEDSDKKLEMQILSLLEKIGYPMDEIGTYFYKRIIFKVIKILEAIDRGESTLNNEELIAQLQNPFSQFYVEVAKIELDIGIKTFHMYVGQANSEIDYLSATPEILYRIYSNSSEDMDYGEHAFLLSSFLLGKVKPKRQNSPLIRRLNKLPKNN